MDSNNHLELISKLRQRLVRLIKLAEPNQIHPTSQPTNDSNRTSTENIEECVRRLFKTSVTAETFIHDVQRILNVTIKSSLSLFLAETLPLAHQYLQQHQYDPFSWETFKVITIQPANMISTTSSTRLPSLQQARFRLPPSCPQLIDLTASVSTRSTEEHVVATPNLRSDASTCQQKLAHRFAQHQFFLKECGEEFFLQTLHSFLRYIIRRLHFFAQHRIDTTLFTSDRYQMTNNVREQIRFLVDLNKLQNGGSSQHLHNDEQKSIRSREHRLSVVEELRQREADETACLVLRESRLKRQKLLDGQQKPIPRRLLRASLQDLIVVMENEPTLRRSKALLYCYANR